MIKGNSNFAILIQAIAKNGVDKTALNDALNDVPIDGFHNDNDKWNGKKYSETGFWAEMQAIVNAAQAVFGNDAATQDEIDAATASLNQKDPDSDLSKAIANLIPIEQLNATYLYETVTAEQKLNRPENRYTADTWAVYAEAKSEAEEYLASLFNTDGSANTAVNKAANQDTADGKASALAIAAENLYTVAARDAARKSLQRGWEMLSSLIELAEQAKEEDYTESSWTAFADKLAEAKSIPEPVPTFTAADRETAQALIAQFNKLYQAFYCELIPKGAVTVTLQCLDPYHVRHKAGIELPYEYAASYGTEIFVGALQKVTLTETPTLAAALSAVGLSVNDAASNSSFGTKVLINGVYVTENYAEASYDTRPSIYSSLRLHPGDRVTVIWDTDPLSGLGQTVGYTLATLWQYENSLAAMRFADEGETLETIEARAAEPFTLVLEKASAALTGERDYSPAEGMAVLVSETQTEAAGNHPTATFAEENGERILSAADGSITMTLYEEGWVLLAAFDVDADEMGDDATTGMTIGDYHSVNFGAAIWVHVLPAEDTEAIKTQLKEELTALRDAYPESIFAEMDWISLNAICDKALTDIDAAADVGTARSLQQTAISGIQAIQEKTLRENEEKPAAFRAALAQMPEDLNLLTEAQTPQVEALIATYEALTPYQLTLLTESEISRYEEIKALYDAGLGASTSYTLTLAITADTAEATAAAQAFTAWLRANTATADKIGDVPAVQLGEYGAFRVNNTPQADPAAAQPLQNIRMAANLNYSLWFLLRDAESHTLSGDGWSVSDPNVTLSPSSRSLANDVTGSVTVLFNGVEYEVKGITVEGVDADSLRWRTESCLDTSTYKGKIKNDVNLYFDETWLEFSMPYQDVTVTVEWQPVSPLSKLEAAYRSYSKSDYTAEKWNVLTAAYEEGKTRIAAAESTGAANTALAEAVAAMAAVPKRGANELGSVYVTVRNDTGKTADGAAWEGVLVDNMVVNLKQDSTMMSCIAEALAGHTVIGVETGYISSIDGLAEFSCGKKSGWMGTLNDWFVNEGFTQFSVANDKLHDGDVICVEYTCELGLDIRGGTEKNKDTTLYALTLTGGDLSPEFNTAETEYVFTLKSGVTETKIEFTNNNRAFQSRAYLNNYAPTANNWIRSGDTVSVSGCDVIYVGVGESAWPAMGTGTPTKYKVTIISPNDASGVVKLIDAIGSVTYSNYKDKQAAVDLAKAAYEALTDEAKAKVSNYATLTKAEALIEGYQNVGALKASIAALPKIIEDTKDVRDVVEDYAALKDLGLDSLLTIAEINKIELAAELLDILDAIKDTDFITAEAYDRGALNEALVKWLNDMKIADSVSVSVDSYNDAVSGKEGSDGSYSATVTLRKGKGTAKKTVSGAITRSSDTGVSEIVVNKTTRATGSGTVWSAVMPYGSDPAAAQFSVTLSDKTAGASAPATADGGKTWTFTVTAEDGSTADYTVTLTVSEVKVTVLDSNVYDVSDDTVVTSLSPVGVSGLDAVVADDLDLPVGTKEASVWLMLRIKEQSGDELTLTVTVWYAADGKDADMISDVKLKDVKLTVTVPLAGTEYAKVRFGSEYLKDTKGSADGIEFPVTAAGDYTLIPDASLVKVTFHLNGGTSTAVTDGQQIVYFPEDVTKDLPLATREGDYSFEGWFRSADGSGEAYTKVSADLPTDLYAVWKSLEEDVEVIEYIDKKKVSVDSVLEEDGTVVVTVKSAEPCVVILKDGDSYVPLKAVKDGDSYVFSQTDYKESMVFIVAAKGDFDKDGDLDLDDFTTANQAIIGNEKIDTLQLLIMGANGKKLKTVDLAKLYLALASGKVEW